MTMKQSIEAVVNGEPVTFLASPRQTLLDALRDELGLTGTKEGCSSGDCGACSVRVDGRLVCACLVLAPEARGRTIETVEGLAAPGQLHPVQQQFLEHAALQCGFCTPGLLMAAKDLLDRNPDPTDTEIRFALAGNLCRCTGYDKIVRAVHAAAVQMRGRPAMPQEAAR
jgi:aerobic carbon-monoxide dehydrogenase small subunit